MTADNERLLASKSNYTRLMEGSNVLSYPSELTTNLTSKRTSHKIAEQGRRNRINTAIQQIAMLLPGNDGADPSGGGGGDDDDDDDEKKEGKTGPVSKARTVELATEYINQLLEQVREANLRAQRAEKILEEERRRWGGAADGG